ncbi:MAG: HU family DNA-binding protein [Methylotetracoccus sp.]
MDKKDLIDAIATETGLKRSKVDDVLNALAANVHMTIAQGREVAIPNVCRISVKQRAARPGRNPRTGETIDIPARRVPHISPVKALKDVAERLAE